MTSYPPIPAHEQIHRPFRVPDWWNSEKLGRTQLGRHSDPEELPRVDRKGITEKVLAILLSKPWVRMRDLVTQVGGSRKSIEYAVFRLKQRGDVISRPVRGLVRSQEYALRSRNG